MDTIGIIGQKKDPHVMALAAEIKKRAGKPVVIDFSHFPKFNLLALNHISVYDDITVRDDIDSRDLDVIYIRNFGASRVRVNGKDDVRYHTSASSGVTALQFSFVNMMAARIPVINDLKAASFHRLKAYQYHLLRSKGFCVPKTCATNNRERAVKFIADEKRNAIVKPNASGAEVVKADQASFKQLTDVMPQRPFIFQQFVSGRSFRAYVLGGRIVSMGEIEFDRTFVDWRERVQRVIPYEPDKALRRDIEAAARTLQLAYCGIDIEYDNATGDYFLLDFNPSALFTGWSRLIQVNLAGQIADYLMEIIRNGGKIWR